MTDYYYQDEDDGIYGTDAPPALRRRAAMQGVATLAGLVVSLSMIIGAGIWGYRLLVRDVEGIPVIQAMDGAFRSQPMEPGGMQAPNQGLEVNRIAAGTVEEQTVDEVRLAPEPVGVLPDDAPGLSAQPEAGGSGGPESEAPSEEIGVMADGSDAAQGTDGLEDVPADASSTDAAVAEAMRAALDAPSPEFEEPAPEIVQNAAYTVRPEPRPGRGTTTAAPSSAASAGQEVAPDSLATGARLAQLGAYETPQIARANWERIVGEHPDAFAGKSRVVQEAQANGGTFYRLRVAGFDDATESQRFCTALMAEGSDCIPVAMR